MQRLLQPCGQVRGRAAAGDAIPAAACGACAIMRSGPGCAACALAALQHVPFHAVRIAALGCLPEKSGWSRGTVAWRR